MGDSWGEILGKLQEDLSEDEALGGLSQEQWDLMDWDSTPRDLREEGQKSLTGYCKSVDGLSVSQAMKWQQLETYRVRRRQLSIEKGETDHKTRVVLEALYTKAIGGDVAASKEFLRHYHAEEPAKPNDQGEAKGEAKLEDEPKSIEEMTVEELEAWQAKTS